MAKVELLFPSGFLEAVDSLENGFPAVAEDMLDAMGEVILPEMKKRLQGVIDNVDGRSTGELADSLGVAPVKVDHDGNYNTKVGFREPRRDGKVNALIANVIEHGLKLEYGSSKRAAKPFLKPTRQAARRPAIDAARRVFEQWVAEITRGMK